jgi:glycosyltransferase involved in cell wall biosynthesis
MIDPVSVVLPARNAGATIGAQLAALADQHFAGTWELVVVDDRSVDDTADRVAEFARERPYVRLIGNRGRGIAHARNSGIAAATYDVIVFCDGDDVASRGWLLAMATALDREVIAGGTLELTELNDRRTIDLQRKPNVLPGVAATMRHLPYAIGASLGLRRITIDRIGGFDTALPGHEDVEFCWRAQQNGVTVVHVPAAVMHYRLRSRMRDLARQRFRYGVASGTLYGRAGWLGVPQPDRRDIVADYIDMLRRAPSAWTSRDRLGAWIYDSAWLAGCAEASRRTRRLCPTS